MNSIQSLNLGGSHEDRPATVVPAASGTSRPERKEISRAALSLVDQVVVSGTNFATLALLANWCEMSPAEVGVFSLTLTIVGFLRTGQERMLSNPYLVFVHQPEREPISFLGSSLYFQSRFATAGTVIVFFMAGFFWYLGKPAGISSVLLVMAMAVPFLLLRDHIRAVCAAHYRFEVALVMDVFVCILQLGGLCLLTLLGWLTISTLAAVLGLACFVPTMAWRFLRPQPSRLEPSALKRDWRTSWNYSRWLLLARTLGMGGFYVVPWMVVFLLDEHESGVFATCSILVGISLMFLSGANNYFQPRTIRALHERGLEAMSRSILETIAVVGTVLTCVSVAFFFVGGWLMPLIFGESYESQGLLVVLLSVSTLAVCVSVFCGNGFAALAKPKGIVWGELAYCVITILLASLLIPHYRLNGAALALIGGGVAASVVNSVTLAKLIQREKRRLATATTAAA